MKNTRVAILLLLFVRSAALGCIKMPSGAGKTEIPAKGRCRMRKAILLMAALGVMVAAGCDSPSSPTPTTPEPEVSAVPLSGAWNFQMTGATENLSGSNCPTQSGGFSSGGTAQLTVSDDGDTAVLDIDGNSLNFTRVGDSDYKTPKYDFPVRDGNDNIVIGKVFYEMTATSETSIVGSLVWDNTVGCTGNYPFTMEHL